MASNGIDRLFTKKVIINIVAFVVTFVAAVVIIKTVSSNAASHKSSSKQSIDSLPPEVATKVLAWCYAYHQSVKKDNESINFSPFFKKQNIRGNLTDEAVAWSRNYVMANGDARSEILTRTKEGCRMIGLPD